MVDPRAGRLPAKILERPLALGPHRVRAHPAGARADPRARPRRWAPRGASALSGPRRQGDTAAAARPGRSAAQPRIVDDLAPAGRARVAQDDPLAARDARKSARVGGVPARPTHALLAGRGL